MNVNMQTMDGLTATSLIHRYFPKAKVMIVSVDNTQKMKDAAHLAGASAFVARDNLSDILSHLKHTSLQVRKPF
jgi:DNA-binding NarL/FixJ family response regulator